eukprot:EG_transcript_32863
MADAADALPRAQVLRAVKAALPEGYRLDDPAKTGVSNAAVLFVLCATSHALDAAKRSKRSTITKPDVLAALEDMGFEHFLPQLQGVTAKRPKPNPALPAEPGATDDAANPGMEEAPEPEDPPSEAEEEEEEPLAEAEEGEPAVPEGEANEEAGGGGGLAPADPQAGTSSP